MPSVIFPGISSVQHRVQCVHGDYLKYQNQGQNQDNTLPQARQEYIWEEASIHGVEPGPQQ